jgi:RimJ/RimL family protein N-acetyltransferase
MFEVRHCQFARIRPFLAAPPFNVYFARAVIEGHMTGTVYADDLEMPKAAYILHPCGMSLLCGSTGLEPFTSEIVEYMLDKKRMRKNPELVQVFPDAWQEELSTRLGTRLLRMNDPRRPGLDQLGVQELGKGRVIEWSRVNFEFDRNAFQSTKEPILPSGLHLQRTGKNVFHPWEGPVMPSSFWSSPEEFEKNGTAFAICRRGRPLCVAFSAWVFDDVLEIGIETHPEARRQGLATLACAALIRYALSRGLEPVWSAHSENKASQILAVRLGFKETRRVPYYRLVEGGA